MLRIDPSGSVHSEFTITRLSDGYYGERFYIVSGCAAHDYDLDFLQKSKPAGTDILLRDVTNQYGVLGWA